MTIHLIISHLMIHRLYIQTCIGWFLTLKYLSLAARDHTCVNAMRRWPYWPSRMEVSYCTSGFGTECMISLCQAHKLLAAMPLWLISERHHSLIELQSTVCSLPRWAKLKKGYWFVGMTLLAAWSSLYSKWCLRSCTNIIIKAVSGKLVWKQH